jgi:hypothetical protein
LLEYLLGKVRGSLAPEHVGTILEDSRKEQISRLKSEVEENNLLCNTMESEIDYLLRASNALPAVSGETFGQPSRFNIDELYWKVLAEDGDVVDSTSEQTREAFWRDMNQSEDSFETIARFFAKGVGAKLSEAKPRPHHSICIGRCHF